MTGRPLTPRQERFVDEYLVDLNGTQAAIRAGYAERGAAVRAVELLRNRNVGAAIATAKGARSERVRVTEDRILEEIDTLSLSDIGDLYDEHGHLKPIRDWPAQARRSVSSMKVRRYPLKEPEIGDHDFEKLEQLAGTLKDSADTAYLAGLAERLRKLRLDRYEIIDVRLWDKNSGLEKSARHRGMFVELHRDLSVDEYLKRRHERRPA
jgi:terminase small subunit-like protein